MARLYSLGWTGIAVHLFFGDETPYACLSSMTSSNPSAPERALRRPLGFGRTESEPARAFLADETETLSPPSTWPIVVSARQQLLMFGEGSHVSSVKPGRLRYNSPEIT
ncbi:MAG TPA: hypothetical protein VIX19_21465, partial [Terriglobales bacterium]